jgi:glycosyltransferase involved in cell wall biosynthesis
MSIIRHKILVSAYGCEPLKGSESGVGWNWILQMAKNNELHVITRSNNREPIEAHLPQDVKNNIHFHYYDTNHFIRKFKNRAKGLYFYYFCWQLGIVSVVRKLCAIYKFDYSMHLTFGSVWMPTFLPFFNIPFIWGPVGGGDGEPKSFQKLLPFKQRIMRCVREALNKTTILNPSIFLATYRAIAILVRTENSGSIIPKVFRSKNRIILETAMESEIFYYLKENRADSATAIQLITTGRLTSSKNILTAVKSLKYIPAYYSVLFTIVGSGIEKSKILAEIEENHLSHRVRLIEETTRENVLTELTKSDIFLFPSLREGGSWALMEAMAIGLPVICLDWSGMKVITDEQSAIRLPVTDPKQMPKDMASAICRLIDHPELREQMGNAGRERIRTVFNWEAKGAFLENLLDELDAHKLNG